MRRFLIIFAYWNIGTTPFQLGFAAWGTWIIFTSDATLLSLSIDVFVRDHLSFLYFIKAWLYGFIWNPLLDLVFALPFVLHQLFEAVVTTWLGLWLLPIAKKMPH